MTEFLKARRVASQFGTPLEFSGVRLDETHGPNCEVMRDVLHLTPDGKATGCFFSLGGSEIGGERLTIGALNDVTGTFDLRLDRVDAHRSAASRLRSECVNCIAGYQCTRGCPDV